MANPEEVRPNPEAENTKVDVALRAIAGAAVGALGVIGAGNVIGVNSTDAAILNDGMAITGALLLVNSAIRFMDLKRS